MNNLVAQEGPDVILPVSPSKLPTPLGAILGAIFSLHFDGSQRDWNRRRLTYLMILSATKDLREILLYRHNYFEATFEIWESRVGRVSGGSIKRRKE